MITGARIMPPTTTLPATTRSALEEETGGTPYDAQAGYDALDPSTQMRAAGSLGLKGVAVVHALADGAELYAESASMTALLRSKSVPTDTYTVGRGNGGPDRTIAGAAGAGGADPMAGYEPDGANGAIVIKTGLTALWGIVDKAGPKPADQPHVVNG